jgi:hypothetical protein
VIDIVELEELYEKLLMAKHARNYTNYSINKNNLYMSMGGLNEQQKQERLLDEIKRLLAE